MAKAVVLKSVLTLISLQFGLTACALFERSQFSGYEATGESSLSSIHEYRAQKHDRNWGVAREELGLTTTQELTDEQVSRIHQRVELNRLERNLPNQLERRQYFGLKPYFNSDLERIYFLRLPTIEARERWAINKGITTDEKVFDAPTTYLIENNDIAKNMTRNAVKQSWGEPDFIEVAGDPLYGNERWRYNKLVSSEDGYRSESRIIYFEAGRVIGWETTQ